MQLGFASVVAFQSPFFQDADGNLKVVIAQVVQVSERKIFVRFKSADQLGQYFGCT